jgi:hypothetical protein
LVALRKVGIDIVLPVEFYKIGDRTLESETASDRLVEAVLVENRKHARETHVQISDLRVWVFKDSAFGCREHFVFCLDLNVKLKAHFQPPFVQNRLAKVSDWES